MKFRHILRGSLTAIFLIKGVFDIFAQEEKYIGLFVYNFTKYFEWSESMRTGSFTIEVFGHKSVYDELTKLTAGKSVGGQPIVIKNISSIEEIAKSHILFIGHWQSRLINDVLTKINSNNTLVITEFEGMLLKGSAINFVIRDNNIKFEINITNAKNKGLKVDPRIRELALKVVD